MSAEFTVRQVGPMVSIQDAGRIGFQRFGVTESGPMDRFAHQLSNYAIGNPGAHAAIEVSLGGIMLECTAGSVHAAIAGGEFKIELDGQTLSACSSFLLQAGSVLTVRPGQWGSWCYLAFAGDIQSRQWLGSQSVLLDTGLCGQTINAGDSIKVDNTRRSEQAPRRFLDAQKLRAGANLRIVLGPQDQYFSAASIAALLSDSFSITPDYNRMGVRLRGPRLQIESSLDMPSEPVARGSLQVPGHGDPLLLMADHQTTGGYPKIATVISCDQDRFAQLRVGDSVCFERCEVAEAIEEARTEHARRVALLAEVSAGIVSLDERLLSQNLISGMIDALSPDNGD